MTILANVYPTGSGGPILNYKTNGWGVHLWQFESTELFVRFVHRNGVFHKPIASRVLQVRGSYLETLNIFGDSFSLHLYRFEAQSIEGFVKVKTMSESLVSKTCTDSFLLLFQKLRITLDS